ncbi:Extracytoplasmic solute receptor protein yiaO [uncultured Clostridium sp.]|uniref:TRAP transporter substrate-binding protein n=1 Tax=Muricoprocola aceti TaxID=2981772 RepID=A0ABT2SIH7_9FIRM|nr:TRAP transporter substrate-binding protein [Muricoprocola aceti]MCQ4773719.1 TRAP transporter substrate-binding protein [Lacrimispora saccharolytica]MCU6724304.1 TRAP transporter substrate-binding protein [Muricoprocola aceti]SCH08810.1 Extracytoplasmic solute receptor protein yiaO [uncultured Clostridium sp.]
MKNKLMIAVMAGAMVSTMMGIAVNAEGTIAAKYSVVFPATGTQADGANKLGEFIKEESDGRIEMEFYPSSQLGDKIAAMEGMIQGTIEMSEFSATDFSNYDSMWSVCSLPYLWDSGEQAIEVFTDTEVTAFMEEKVEKCGMKIIAWQNLGSRSILNTKHAVNEPADLNGLKVRCMQDSILAGTINAMGASATPLAWGECYTALQQGTIDGVENSEPVLLANGMQEVAKYLSLTEQFIIPDPVVVSKVWFDGLSEEDQQAMLKAGEDYTKWYNEELWPNAEQEAQDALIEAGVEVNEVDKEVFKEAVQPVIDDYLSSATEDQKAFYELLVKVRDNQ